MPSSLPGACGFSGQPGYGFQPPLLPPAPPLSPVHITRCWKSILVPFTTFKRGSTALPPAVSVSGSEKLPGSFERWFCLAFSCGFFVWPCRGCKGGRERINWAPRPSVPLPHRSGRHQQGLRLKAVSQASLLALFMKELKLREGKRLFQSY